MARKIGRASKRSRASWPKSNRRGKRGERKRGHDTTPPSLGFKGVLACQWAAPSRSRIKASSSRLIGNDAACKRSLRFPISEACLALTEILDSIPRSRVTFVSSLVISRENCVFFWKRCYGRCVIVARKIREFLSFSFLSFFFFSRKKRVWKFVEWTWLTSIRIRVTKGNVPASGT